VTQLATEFFVVEANLTQIWEQFVFADGLPPLLFIIDRTELAEITVTNLQAFAKRRRGADDVVDSIHLIANLIHKTLAQNHTKIVLERLAKLWLNIAERKPTAQGIIHDGN
jgi:hypothetical protein